MLGKYSLYSSLIVSNHAKHYYLCYNSGENGWRKSEGRGINKTSAEEWIT